MPLFRKNTEFKVVKPAEKQEEAAKTVSEPESKPTEVKREPLDLAELEKLRGQWREALVEHFQAKYPNVLTFKQDGDDRYFYVLKRLGEKSEPGVSTRFFRCLRDDFHCYDIKQTVRWDPYGAILEAKFEKLDPQKAGLDAAKIMQLIDQIIKGDVP
jgi:hypothetical protein